MLLLLWPN
nr:unnamed protein product [Callosobruchus analis]CAI5862249.1 unnamed protein product [Callosobruchus analis]